MKALSILKFIWSKRWQSLCVLLAIWSIFMYKLIPPKIVKETEKVYVAPEIRYLEKVKTVKEPIEVVRYLPTAEEVSKIEAKTGMKLPPGPLLGVKDLEAMPYGGQAVLTVNPDTKHVEATIHVEPAPFFELLNDRELSFDAIKFFDRDLVSGRVEIAQSFLRTGQVTWKAGLGAKVDLGEDSGNEAYIFARASWRF